MPFYDIISTVVLLIFGLGVTVSAWSLGFGRWEEPGTGFMGVLSGVVLSLLSLVWLGISLTRRMHGASSYKGFFPEKDSLRNIIRVLLPLCFFTLIFEHLGYLISSFLFLTYLFKEDSKGWWPSVRLSLIASILTFLIFQVWLQIQFPEGFLPLYRIKQWIS
jgi:Tripartite tricarboxylate transporter TctB family